MGKIFIKYKGVIINIDTITTIQKSVDFDNAIAIWDIAGKCAVIKDTSIDEIADIISNKIFCDYLI